MSSGPRAPGANAGAEPIAIVGMACLFPRAGSLEAYWSNIRRGVDAISDIPIDRWRPDDYYDPDPAKPDMTYARRGGFLEPVDFDPLEFGMSPNNLEATDSTQLLAMLTARDALRDAGYAPVPGATGRDFDRERTGAVLGVTGALELVIPLGARLGHPIWRRALAEAGVDPETADEVVRRISNAYVPWQENSFPGLLGNVAAGRIASRFDLGGTNCVVDAACASSLSALHLAALELRTGRADMMLSGGIDSFNDIFMYMCFSKTPALSASGASRPFSDEGDGTILGEGSGVIVLKRLADARRDGDRVYALVRGIGSASDGRGSAIYAPQARGQARAMRVAYEQSGITPDTVGLVEAHGTGTRVGDATELESLRSVLGDADTDGPWCALGSVKSMIGHTKAAAGIAGLIKATLALHHKVLPPTLHVRRPHADAAGEASPVYPNTEPRPWLPAGDHPRRAAVSAFGFGGSNFHCVLEEVGTQRAGVEWDARVQIVALRAATREALAGALDAVPCDAPWSELHVYAADTRRAFAESAGEHRLVLVVEAGESSLHRRVEAARALVLGAQGASAATPDGTYYGCGPAAGSLAMLFPGQGAQRCHMLRDLALRFPEFLGALADADTGFGESKPGRRLSDRIHPRPSFDEAAREAAEARLRDTRHAQPAIGAVSLGAAAVLGRFGVTPAMTAGHSFGELTALAVAGRLRAGDFHRVAAARGRHMADLSGERGAMLAVGAPLADVRGAIDAESLDLVVANHNAPEQSVLSGAGPEIDRAAEVLGARGMRCRRLDVAAAFHSALVADAATPFAAALRGVEIAPGDCPVYANSTGGAYPADAEAARALLAGQIARPVEFVTEIEAMFAAGARTFVEVGPARALSALVDSILGERPHRCVALDASAGRADGVADLARTLAQVAASGHAVDLGAWDPDAPRRDEKPRGMTVPITGANHVRPRPPVEPARRAPRAVPAAAVPPAPAPAPVPPTPATPSPDDLRHTEALLATIERMQAQTADLHRQYLEGQARAQEALGALIDRHASAAGQPVRDRPAAPRVPDAPVLAPPPPAAASPAPAPRRESVEAPVPAAAVPAPTAPAPDAGGAIESVVLEVVADRTGYPTDMLGLDMSLDADLGIDSIKRVEILSALQDRLPEAPAVAPEDLGTIRTLRDVVARLAAATPAHAPPAPAGAPAAPAPVEAIVLEVVADRTGYPADMLGLDMSLDADLGIDSIKRVEILSALQDRLPGAPAVAPEDLGTIRTLRDVVARLAASGEGSPAPAEPPRGAPATVTPADDAAPDAERAVLDVVADKTGYPADMLGLDMSLDADLGIDSIKRVEILSALQDRMPEAPNVAPEALGTIRTLRDMVGHLVSTTGRVVERLATAAERVVDRLATAAEHVVIEIVADKTGYPSEMLGLDMSLDADLGIDSIKRVEILSALQDRLPDAPSIAPEEVGRLRTLRDVVERLSAGVAVAPADPEPGTGSLERSVPALAPVDAGRARVPLPERGLLVTDDGEGLGEALARALTETGVEARVVSLAEVREGMDVAGLVVLAPRDCDGDFARAAFAAIRRAGPGLRRARGLLAGACRLDGELGFGTGPLAAPLSAALAGIVKTAAREWPEVRSRALDIGGDVASAPALARALINELRFEGPTEVALTSDGPRTVVLRAEPLSDAPAPALADGELVVVSGGARGVTAEAAAALARACRPAFLLLGRSPAPEAEPDWLAGRREPVEIKRALAGRPDVARGGPRAIEAACRRILAAREMRATFAMLRESGSEVSYAQVDVCDASAVRRAVDAARTRFGPVRGIVHGAGVILDQLIDEKTDEQFRAVFDTKVLGFDALVRSCDETPPRFVSVFSSSTGRFGRRGQADYAAANEALNKLARQQARAWPACRVVSVNWGPWAGGMVTPELGALFAQEGIGLIPLRAGAELHLRELGLAPAHDVETVVIARPDPHPQGATSGSAAHSARR